MEPEPDTHALTHAGPKYKPRKGEKNTHFCRWDDDAVGGRWYECVIDGETTYADERGVLVKCLLHDGSVKECPKTEVCPIETVQDGDDCLAYWSGGVFGRAYCFAGKVTEVSEAKEQYLLFWASEPEGTPKWETKVYSHRTIQDVDDETKAREEEAAAVKKEKEQAAQLKNMEDKQAFLAKMKEERQKRKMALQRRARQEHIERQRRGAAAYEANELAKAARKLTPKDELELFMEESKCPALAGALLAKGVGVDSLDILCDVPFADMVKIMKKALSTGELAYAKNALFGGTDMRGSRKTLIQDWRKTKE